jgi:hypothetical protein
VGRAGGQTLRFGQAEAPLSDLTTLWRGAFAEHFA